MANDIIRPFDLPTERENPVASEFMVVDNGVSVAKTTLAKAVNAGRPLASQAEAEAGGEATKAMTPLTTKQSIASEVGVSLASKAQGDLAASAVQSVVAGANITVNATDPRNPIVNASGSVPPAGSITAAMLSNSYTEQEAIRTKLLIGARVFETVAEASAYSPTTAPTFVQTAFYDSARRRGSGATYAAVGAQPTHLGKLSITRRDGVVVWYEINEQVVNPLQFGAVGNGSTDDYAACQGAANTGRNVVFPKGYSFRVNTPLTHTSNYQVFDVQGAIVVGAAVDAAIHTKNLSYVGVTGFGTINGQNLAVNCIHYQTDTTDMVGCFVENVEVKETIIDVTLQRGGILVDNLGGRSSPRRNKKVRISNVRVNTVRTHGICVVYTDGVTVDGNEIDGVRNHGHESINCTDVLIVNNNVKNCEISGLAIGDRSRNWTIANNIVRNCAGDGAISCETISNHGSIHNNQIIDAYGSSCINVSWAVYNQLAPDFLALHNINVSNNNCHAKIGAPLSGTIRGINFYSGVGGGGEGNSNSVHDNTFENVNVGLDLSYLTDCSFNNNKVVSFQGVNPAPMRLTYVNNSIVNGFQVLAAAGDHIVNILASGSNKSNRITVCNVQSFTAPAGKAVVHVDTGTLFNFFGLETNSAANAVLCDDISTSFHAAGITGNFTGTVVSGGTKLTWQA